jgi:hypothetical protein
VKSRDDEVTKRHHGYQRIPSVFETAQKPYYYGSKHSHVSAVFTTALFGSAPEHFTRALLPTTGKASAHIGGITPVIPTVNVTPKRRITPVRGIAAPREGACGEQKSQTMQGAPSAPS